MSEIKDGDVKEEKLDVFWFLAGFRLLMLDFSNSYFGYTFIDYTENIKLRVWAILH